MSEPSTTVIDHGPAAAAAATSSPRARSVLITVVAVVVLAAAIAVAVWSTTGTSSPTAADQVRTSWQTFFKGSTAAATRASLLQNGAAFQAILQGEAHSGFARGLSASVTAVNVTSPTSATVTYAILVGGTLLVGGVHGLAVKQGGTWKVSTASFCGLLALQHVHPAACAAG